MNSDGKEIIHYDGGFSVSPNGVVLPPAYKKSCAELWAGELVFKGWGKFWVKLRYVNPQTGVISELITEEVSVGGWQNSVSFINVAAGMVEYDYCTYTGDINPTCEPLGKGVVYVKACEITEHVVDGR